MWDRVRYSFWAPIYDRLVGTLGFADARRASIDRLLLTDGDRVLIVGAGTGLDLPYIPSGVEITAIDVTPAMLGRLDRRATQLRRHVATQVMDARQLHFPDASFHAVIMHLIVAVMPDPEVGVREAARVLKAGGRIAIFDKFLRDDEHPSATRRLVNVLAKPLFSDLNRRLRPLIAATPLAIESDEAVAFGGAYRVVTLVKNNGSHP
jgi:phosphatidylethanolamine/phosphatidyl-N-methylethanolamine N-methyltransferase